MDIATDPGDQREQASAHSRGVEGSVREGPAGMGPGTGVQALGVRARPGGYWSLSLGSGAPAPLHT